MEQAYRNLGLDVGILQENLHVPIDLHKNCKFFTRKVFFSNLCGKCDNFDEEEKQYNMHAVS